MTAKKPLLHCTFRIFFCFFAYFLLPVVVMVVLSSLVALQCKTVFIWDDCAWKTDHLMENGRRKSKSAGTPTETHVMWSAVYSHHNDFTSTPSNILFIDNTFLRCRSELKLRNIWANFVVPKTPRAKGKGRTWQSETWVPGYICALWKVLLILFLLLFPRNNSCIQS